MRVLDYIIEQPLRAIVPLVVLAVLMVSSLAIVPEDRQALILRYGKIVKTVNIYHSDEIYGDSGAGLTVRIPFIDTISYIDKRILGVNMEQQQVLSTDQLRLQVDAFARFRITDPELMYTTIRTESRLQEQLRTILGSSLRNELGRRTFVTLLSAERGEVMQKIKVALNQEASKYGAEIIDVRIKRADLPAGTPLDSAFERMRSARRQEAVTIRAEGQKEAQIIRGDASAEAARIYAESYGKDPEFYDFFRAMQSYRRSFVDSAGRGGSTSIILSPNNQYLHQFGGQGDGKR